MPEGQEQAAARATGGNRVILTVVVLAAVLIAGWWLFNRRSGVEHIDMPLTASKIWHAMQDARKGR